jgi:hypothetical protein
LIPFGPFLILDAHFSVEAVDKAAVWQWREHEYAKEQFDINHGDPAWAGIDGGPSGYRKLRRPVRIW